MSKWIKKGDKVLIMAGNDKGKVGEVLSRKGDRVVVQGVNIRKKHLKRRSQAASSGIIEMEVPLHVTNVSVCTPEGKPVKLKVKQTAAGGKELFYLLNGEEVSYRQVRKA